MWNRSGLPATIPLQVKTKDGADFLLQLRETDTGNSILAAYVRGGEFFRVLVPAGRYELLFVSGTEWQGEAAQFGPDTFRFVLDPPLTFRATMSRKNGHLIDLRDTEAITIRDFAICQRFALDPKRSLNDPYHWTDDQVLGREPHRRTDDLILGREPNLRTDDLILGRDPHRLAGDLITRREPHQYTQPLKYHSYPWRYDMQSRFCD